MKRTGFIGLGIMGLPMAKNLVRAGVKLLVCDLNMNAVKQMEELGCQGASYRQIGEQCDVIFMILPNGTIVQEVLLGKDGVASGLHGGEIVCDMSSVTPHESQTCYARLKEMNVGFVDAPVSGGEPGAINGTLAIMCGGEDRHYQELLPYFHIMGKSALLIGESGSGSVTKLANQVIVNLNIAAMSEAFVLAAKAGVDPMRVYHAIRSGLAGSAVLDAKAPMICSRNFKPGGKISINHKDIKNVLETAHSLDVPVPFSAQLFEIMQSLKVDGHMEDDHCGIVQYFEKLANIEVASKENQNEK